MDKLLKNSELEKEIRKHSEKFIQDLLKKPREVGKITDGFYLDLFKLCGFEGGTFEELFKDVEEGEKKILRDRLTALNTVLLMAPPKNYDDEFSAKIDELFKICKDKNSKSLEKVFQRPRLELFRKLLSSWKRSWRVIDEKGLPKEAIIDNKFRIVKSFSEGIYRQLLIVIQEMMQIAFGYGLVKKFGVIIHQLEENPVDLSAFVNKTAYNIRNRDSDENVEFEEDNTITLFDKDNNVIQKLTEDDLEQTITWLSNFTQSVFYTLQKNYFELIGIKSKTEDRVGYLIESFLDIL